MRLKHCPEHSKNKTPKDKKNKALKYIILGLLLIVFTLFFLVGDIHTATRFSHGAKPTSKVNRWRQKSTRNFCVMYRDKYLDPEKTLAELCEQFQMKPAICGIKIKVFVQQGRVYAKPGGKEIYAWNETELKQGITYALFYQINKHAPSILQEGIAAYAQYEESKRPSGIDINEVIELEKKLKRAAKAYNRLPDKPGEIAIENGHNPEGYRFAANLIQKKGIGEFKEFYRRCSGSHRIERVYKEIYR